MTLYPATHDVLAFFLTRLDVCHQPGTASGVPCPPRHHLRSHKVESCAKRCKLRVLFTMFLLWCSDPSYVACTTHAYSSTTTDRVLLHGADTGRPTRKRHLLFVHVFTLLLYKSESSPIGKTVQVKKWASRTP
jgi:hypothetical protein